ncbi:MAG TPA: hypothetical protein VM186_14775 [Planctomycetota bacterium]|nr:hypothetical protein [Planctomycetota bacterium]
MNLAQYTAPWHKRSYECFVKERLPELIASRVPLEGYGAAPTGPYTCKLSLTVANAAGKATLEFNSILAPDETGLFVVDGKRIVVVPTASCDELDKAEIRCVGEQLYEFVEPRIGEAPPDLQWDEALVRSWLPLDKWLREFLGPANLPTVMPLDDRNWLSRCEHLRRIVINVPVGRQKFVASGQLGRVCPLMTPEGPNLGRVLFVARGGDIRDGRIIAVDERPEAKLSVTASLVPFLECTDTNRALMGCNMVRQWLVLEDAEPALVQTGNEPDAADFWCGRNLLTAFVSWGRGTFEDGVIISESCARKFCFHGLIEPGDKVSNRHGSKGVISQILPDDQMPHLQDGTPVELVWSFIGLHTRLNFGQLREAVLGRIAHAEGVPVIVPPFGAPTDDDIRRRLRSAGLPESGMEALRMGKNGPPLERPSTVGYVYWGIMDHLVRNKMRVTAGCATEKLLPKDGSQRRGEMEYWALRDVGAFESILESFNLTSCERDGAGDLTRQLAGQEVEQAPPPTPMFMHLQRRLAAGGIRMQFTGSTVTFVRAIPPGEKLTLAVGVAHPWMFGAPVNEVGAVPELDEFHRLSEANEQMRRVLAGNVPGKLVERSRGNLERAVQEFFGALLGPEGRIVIGSTVAFSGRTVIAPTLDLRIDQAGMAEEMAWTLFGPIVSRELGGEQDVRKRTKRATEKLDEIMARSWVVLSRAQGVMLAGPTDYTAHIRLTSHLAFHPVRRANRVLRLHPLACMLMNADFDGDQMAVFLPITAAAQREAGERLSVAAHLRRDPGLIAWVLPSQEALWGLAHLSLSESGRKQIAAIAGSDLTGTGGIVTRDSVTEAMRQILSREGEEKTLEILQQLMALGFEAAKRSGASMSPFAGETLSSPPPPDTGSGESCHAYIEAQKDEILSRSDYASHDLGPQLLAVKSGARGNVMQLTRLIGLVIADEQYRLFFSPRRLISGLDPDIYFVYTLGAKRGLGQLSLDLAQAETDWREACSPKGFGVLARAMRSRQAGPVFGRAALNGEVDPLTDVDARLFVGLKP